MLLVRCGSLRPGLMRLVVVMIPPRWRPSGHRGHPPSVEAVLRWYAELAVSYAWREERPQVTSWLASPEECVWDVLLAQAPSALQGRC